MTSPQWSIEWQSAFGRERRPLDRRLLVGRAAECDIVLSDPFVSRRHCTIGVEDGQAYVDARAALNRVFIDGREVEVAVLGAGQSFRVGATDFRVWGPVGNDVPTERLEYDALDLPLLVLRISTRELVDHEGTLIARFSPAECLAFVELARHFPDAASHAALGRAIWAGDGFDLYQLHRLLQRVRTRLGDAGALVESVRGAGYRVRMPVGIR